MPESGNLRRSSEEEFLEAASTNLRECFAGLLRVLENLENLEMSGNLIFCQGKAGKPGIVMEF